MPAKTTFHDSSGRSLTDYPRPSVAVDTALVTAIPGEDGEPGTLGVLLVRRPTSSATGRGGWALPGSFLHQGETLAEAVRRSLAVKAGVTGRTPLQLHVFDDPKRDDRGWVLSVAHLDVLVIEELEALRNPATTRIAPIPLRARLPYDHGAIIGLAVQRMRQEYLARPDPHRLLPDAFTIYDLRAIHEAVAGARLQKDTFRRFMIDQLHEQPHSTTGRRGRPAALFTRVT